MASQPETTDQPDLSHNSNWCQLNYADPYADFQNALLDLGLGLRTPGAKAAYRNWPVAKLTQALANWHRIVESTLFYGNAYQIQFVLPHADLRLKELRAELTRRATPQLQAHSPAKTIRGFFNVREVRAKVDAFDIFAQFLPDLTQKGREYVATCPFHKPHTTGQAHTPSLSVNRELGVFRCLSCQAAGSMFDFVMQLEQLPFAEAVNRVAQLGNL